MESKYSRRAVLQTIAGGAVAATVVGQGTAADRTVTSDELLWSTPDAQFPTVVDGTVYASNNTPSEPAIRALDAETGDLEWESDDELRVAQAPQVVDGRVFYSGGREQIQALDADSGDKLWTYPIDSLGPSPTVAGGTVYAPENVRLHAIDVESGEEEWMFEADGEFDFIEAPPTVTQEKIYVGNDNGLLWAIDRTDGSVEWQRQLQSRTNHAASVGDGVVFVGSHTSDDASVYALDAEDGEILWEFPLLAGPLRGAITISGGTVFADSGEYLYAIDAETSEEQWRFNHASDEESRFSSPTVAEGVVYLAGNDRTLYGINTLTGEEEWRFEHDDRFEENRFFLDDPIVVDGVIYFSIHERIDRSELMAVDVETDRSSVDSRVMHGTLSHHDAWTGDPLPLEFGFSNVGESVPENPRDEALDEEDDPDDSDEQGDDTGVDEQGDDDSTEQEDDDSTEQGTDDADDDGPGFGVGAGLAGLGGAGYLLKRRLTDDVESE